MIQKREKVYHRTAMRYDWLYMKEADIYNHLNR